MNEPKKIQAGLSAEWTETSNDYLASLYTLKYVFINSSAKISVSSTADGDTHSVEIPAATTASWTAGVYKYTGYLEKIADSANKIPFSSGTITITANVLTASTADMRSHARKVLDAINATLEGRASKDQQSISLNGRSLQYTVIADLLTLRSQYMQLVKQEEQEDRIQNGGPAGNMIKVRF